jgi:hypothetical protein
MRAVAVYEVLQFQFSLFSVSFDLLDGVVKIYTLIGGIEAVKQLAMKTRRSENESHTIEKCDSVHATL